MSRFFKSAAFPILIVIVLAFFASKLISPTPTRPRATSFNTFLTQLDDGDVKTATLRTKDNSIEVTLDRADKNKYTVGYPADYAEVLVNNLRQAQARATSRLRRQARALERAPEHARRGYCPLSSSSGSGSS